MNSRLQDLHVEHPPIDANRSRMLGYEIADDARPGSKHLFFGKLLAEPCFQAFERFGDDLFSIGAILVDLFRFPVATQLG